MATVVYDSDFTGFTLNQPPPNTTQRWSTANTTQAVRAIAGFTGDRSFEVSTGTGTEDRLRSFDAGDGLLDVQTEIRERVTTINGASCLTVIRGSGTGGSFNGTAGGYYFFLLNSGGVIEFRLHRLENGGGSNVISGTQAEITIAEGDFLNLDLTVQDSPGQTDIQAIFWKDGDPKPTEVGPGFWTYTDLNPLPAGWVAIGNRNANGRIDYDTVKITDLAAVAAPPVTNVDVDPTPGSETTSLRISWDNAAADDWQIRFDTAVFDPDLGEGTLILDGPGTLVESRRHFDHTVPDPNPAINYFYTVRSSVNL